jgi:hypothetical protein
MSNAVVIRQGPMFEASDVAYLHGLADKMERGFYSVNPQWVRDLAARVEGTLCRLVELGGCDCHARCPTYPVFRSDAHLPDCPLSEAKPTVSPSPGD